MMATEVRLNNGKIIELSGQSVQEYIAWRDAMIRQTGQELASKMPKFYGSIEFNIQNGKFVNANMKIGIK